MIYIILASIFAGFGSYILRKGDLLNFINGLITLNFSNLKFVDYTITGIILNLIAIFLWSLFGFVHSFMARPHFKKNIKTNPK